MKTILVLFIFFLGFKSMAQTIDFEDPNLKLLLTTLNTVDSNNDGVFDALVDTNGDGEIQISEALAVERLRLQELNSENPISLIHNLTYFQNLKRLDLIGLAGIQVLNDLNIEGLEFLWIGNCFNLKTIDISEMPNISNLRIEDMPDIEYLNIQNGSYASDYFSLFYSINIHYACVDDLGDELERTNESMLSGVAANTINCELLSIEEYDDNFTTIYPNPFKNNISILTSETIESIKIYNISGQLIEQWQFNNGTLHTEKLSSGVYFLQLEFNDRTITKKMIKK
ncbi:T9SS type A sorting domain-containing protein [Psychroserpens sp.]